MKSAKTVVNGQGKKMSRIGLLSLVTWMVVSLSAGTALAADYTLRKVDRDGNPGDAVDPISLQQEKDAKELLTAEPINFKSYAEKFSKEPTAFVEGIWKALVSINESDKRELFKKSVKDGLDTALASQLDSDKDALVEVVAKLFKISNEDIKKLTRDELLKELFLTGKNKKDLLAKLKLTDEDKKSSSVVKNDGKDKRVGELSIEEQAAAICEHFKQVTNSLKEQAAKNMNALNEAFNRIKEMSKLAQVAPVKKDQPEDVTTKLMEELINRQKAQQTPTPVPPQQVASTAPEKDEAPAKSVMDQPFPQPQQQQQNSPMAAMAQAMMMQGMFNNNPVASNSNLPQFSPDLPANTGASAAISRSASAAGLADDALSAGVPSLTNQFTGRPLDPITAQGVLGASKTQTDGALASVTTELKTDKTKLAQLNQVLDKLKNDAANAVPDSLKQLQADKEQVLAKAQAALKAKQDQLAPMTQMAQMEMMKGGSDPSSYMMMQMQQKMMTKAESDAVAQAQADVDAAKAQVNLVQSKAKPAMAGYESDKIALENSVSELQAAKTKLEGQKTQVAAMLQANAQQALASTQQQSPNIYNRLGSAPVSPTQRGRGLGTAMTPTRGSLGGSMSNTSM